MDCKMLFFGLVGRTDGPAVSLELQEWVRDSEFEAEGPLTPFSTQSRCSSSCAVSCARRTQESSWS